MTVDLSPELQAFVTEKVLSGEYRTAQAVIEDAVRLFAQRAQAEQRLSALLHGLKGVPRMTDPRQRDWEGIQQAALNRFSGNKSA
jgi:putative addiction module CopG family antidote